MAQKAEMEFGGKKIHLVTDSDVVIHNGGDLKTALDNAQNYNPARSASAFGKQILQCKNVEDFRELLQVAPENIFDETGEHISVQDGCCVRSDKTAANFGNTVYCPANNAVRKYVHFTQDSFTLDFFMASAAAQSSNVVLFIIGVPGKTGVQIYHNQNAGLCFTKRDSNATLIGSSPNPTISGSATRRFHRITYNAGAWKWYCNGVLKQSGTYNIDVQGANLTFTFGGDVAMYFDEMRILEGVVLTTDVPTAPFSISDYPNNTRCLIHCD